MFGGTKKKNPLGNEKTVSTSTTSKYRATTTSSSTRSVEYSVTKYSTTYSGIPPASANKYNKNNGSSFGRLETSYDAMRNDRSSPFDREFRNRETLNPPYRSPFPSIGTDARIITPSLINPGGYVSPYRSTGRLAIRSPPPSSYQLKPLTQPAAKTSASPSPITQIASALKNPIFTAVEKKVVQEIGKPTNKNIAPKMQPGIVYVFNHEKFDTDNDPRVGTQEDVQKLKRTFNGRFKMETNVFNNLKVKQIELEAKKIEKQDFSKKSCVVIVILTHGNRHDIVSARDDVYSIDDVILFPMLRNKTLAKKPKIFIVQACKGDKATAKYGFADATPVKLYAPLEIAKLYSTFEGFVSYRGKEGSMFIQTLCENLERDGFTKNVIQIMEETIKQIVEQYSAMQVPTIMHNMTTRLIFGQYVNK